MGAFEVITIHLAVASIYHDITTLATSYVRGRRQSSYHREVTHLWNPYIHTVYHN